MAQHPGPPSTGKDCSGNSWRPPTQAPVPLKAANRGVITHDCKAGETPTHPQHLGWGVQAAGLPITSTLLAPPCAVPLEPRQQTKHPPVLSIPLAPPSRQAHPLMKTAQPFTRKSWTGRKSPAAPGPACVSGCSPAQLLTSHVGAGKRDKSESGDLG